MKLVLDQHFHQANLRFRIYIRRHLRTLSLQNHKIKVGDCLGVRIAQIALMRPWQVHHQLRMTRLELFQSKLGQPLPIYDPSMSFQGLGFIAESEY